MTKSFTLDELTIVGKYGCPACEQRFALLADKKTHIRKVHPRPRKGAK